MSVRQFATFDIWDTCLTRSLVEPRHVFFEVALRVLGASDFDEPTVAELAAIRIRAEETARQRAPKRQCTFVEIIAIIREWVGEEQADAFAAQELELESQSVRPVEAMRAEVASARAQGMEVAFLSDMYLPENFLRQLLVEHGFAEANDRVYVSGEHRAGKPDGAMFRLVQSETGASFSRWTHRGDKAGADVLAPSRLGIEAKRFADADLTPSERRAWELGAAAGRSGSRLVGGMRAVRLGLPFPAERSALFCNVMAPWLCALAAKMVSQAVALGLKRLYFLSRDGEMLLQIARKIAPSNLECRYLYSSRRAWCFPGMVADDSASRRWLETFAVSPRAILGSLDFSQAETAEILSELDLSDAAASERGDPATRIFVWEHLRATGRMERVLESAKQARDVCLAYLEQEGLLQDSEWAVCDVGWVLNGQAALNRILQSKLPGCAVRGLYFMVNRRRPPLAETGPFHAWLLDETLDSGPGSIPETLTHLSGLIEEAFLTSPDPSLRCYRRDPISGQAEPEFAEASPDSSTLLHASELREAVDRLSSEWSEELRDPEFQNLLSQYALAELLRLFRQPSREEASVIAALRHTSEATNDRKDRAALARPWQFSDSLRILGKRSRLYSPKAGSEPLWTAGCDALTSPLCQWSRKWVLAPIPRPSLRLFAGSTQAPIKSPSARINKKH